MASNGGSLIIALNAPKSAPDRGREIIVSLRNVRSVAWAGLVSMSIALVYAFAAGQFRVDGLKLLDNPWGLVTLVDVYVGFALFSCWIVWRETQAKKALMWIALIVVGGNLVSTLYVLIALHESKGNVELFWHGSRWESPPLGMKHEAISYRKRGR